MKSYREFAGPLNNDPSRREVVEWSNTWYDKSNSKEVPDKWLLFVGDCFLRMAKHALNKQMDYPIDLFGSSASMNDILFAEQIDSFFATVHHRYDAIVIQQGHHGHEIDGKVIGQDELQQFENDLRTLIAFLSQYSNRIILTTIFYRYKQTKKKKGLRLFLYRHGLKKEVLDPVYYDVVKAKNDIIRRTARDMNVELCDLAEEMSKKQFLHIDYLHYEPDGNDAITDLIRTHLGL